MENLKVLPTTVAMMLLKAIDCNLHPDIFLCKTLTMQTLANEFLQTATRRLKYYKDLGDKTFVQLTDEQLHFRPNEASNSIAMIVQHMSGNMLSRWTNFLTEDGEKPWRQRDEEFEVHQFSREQVMDLWEKGWSCFFEALASLTEEDLMKTVYIRQEPLTVVDAINRQLAHYPYHVGQLLFIGKIVRDIEWRSLSIPKGRSQQYNSGDGTKDPAKKY
jgi:hypothetical protein